MLGRLVASRDSSSNFESRAFFFWVVLGSEGLGLESGYFFGFLAWSEGLGLDEGGGLFLWVI